MYNYFGIPPNAWTTVTNYPFAHGARTAVTDYFLAHNGRTDRR